MSSVTHISRAYPDRVEIRGKSLTDDLMGKVSFTSYFHLLLTGREPNDDELFFLDLLLVAIAEHGMMPTNVAARMTLAADPNSLQGAVAAGILGAGPVLLGTPRSARSSCSAPIRRTRIRKTSQSGSTRRAASCPASDIRCTSPSTRVPSASSNWLTSAAWPARTRRLRSSSARLCTRHGESR